MKYIIGNGNLHFLGCILLIIISIYVIILKVQINNMHSGHMLLLFAIYYSDKTNGEVKTLKVI